MTAPHRIDVHYHIIPKPYVERLEKQGIRGSTAVKFPKGSEYPVDIVRAYSRLVLHDGFVRFPRIRWVLADSGGALPFLAQRLARAHYTDGHKLRWGRIVKDLAFRGNGGLRPATNVDYDSVATEDPVVQAALERLVPGERIRFGSNFPFGAVEKPLGVAERGLEIGSVTTSAGERR